jgi:hypothetical protein
MASLVGMIDRGWEMRLDTVSSTFSAGRLKKKVSILGGSSCGDITAYRACGEGHDSSLGDGLFGRSAVALARGEDCRQEREANQEAMLSPIPTLRRMHRLGLGLWCDVSTGAAVQKAESGYNALPAAGRGLCSARRSRPIIASCVGVAAKGLASWRCRGLLLGPASTRP